MGEKQSRNGGNLKHDLELLNVTDALWILLFPNARTLNVVFSKTWILWPSQSFSTCTSVEPLGAGYNTDRNSFTPCSQ